MAEQFNQAVSALLQHGNTDTRQRANAWLEQWQQTPEAWSVAVEVLQNSASMDAQYFAAQTLRTKVGHYASGCGIHQELEALDDLFGADCSAGSLV